MEKGKKRVALAIAALLATGTAATTWAATAKVQSIDRSNGTLTLKLSPSMVQNLHDGQSVRITSPLIKKHALRHHHAHTKKTPATQPGAPGGGVESGGAAGGAPSGGAAPAPGGGT